MKTILTLLAAITISVAHGQSYTFQKLCYTDTNTIFNEVTPVSGGYIACGTDLSGDHLLVKMDASGQTLWSKNLGGLLPYESGYRVGEINTGGYYLMGTTTGYSTSESINFIKLDGLGNILWNKVYTDLNNGYIQYPSLRQTASGGFIISATYWYQFGMAHYLFINTDNNGNVLWSKSFAENQTEKLECYDVETNWANNRFTAVGDGADIGIFAVNCDLSGNLMWAKKYATINSDFMPGRAIAKTSDGGYAIASESTNGGFPIPMMVKIDGNGSFLWARGYKIANDTTLNPVYAIRQTTDGGFILGTFHSAYPMLIKTNSSGHFQWSKYYTLGTNIYPGFPALSVKQTPDKGYIIGTLNNDSLATQSMGWIIKTDSLGVTECPEASVTLTDSTIILNTTVAYVDTTGMVANVISYNNTNTTMNYSTSCSHTTAAQDTTTATFITNSIGSKNGIKVFPNPSTGEFTIQKGDSEIRSILVYNMQGEILYGSSAVPADKSTININMAPHARGVYILKIVSDQGTTHLRLIIQ